MNAPLQTLAALAARLRVPVAFLKREASAGRIPCLRAGRSWLFNSDAVERALAEQAAKTLAKPGDTPCEQKGARHG